MKFFLPFLFSFVALHLTAQDSTIALSRFEAFSSQPGKLLKTETRPLGEVGIYYFAQVTTTDIAAATKVSAIKIYNERTWPAIVDPKVLYIDVQDLDSVLKVLDFFAKELISLQPSADLHYSWFTPGDVEVSVSWYAYYEQWTFSIGKVYQKLRTGVPGATIRFNRKKIPELIEVLGRAITDDR